RQARGARGRDQAAGRPRGQRQDGLSHRDPDPLGLRRHRRPPRSDQGSQLARQRADAVRGRRQLPQAGVQGVPGQHREDLMDRVAEAPPAVGVWAARRRRARLLSERHSFAGELLRLYAALLDVQERTFLRAIDDRPGTGSLARYVGGRVIARVAERAGAHAPPPLSAAVPERLRHGDPAAFVAAWLAGELQPAVDQYLARAAPGPGLGAEGPGGPAPRAGGGT